MHAADIVHPDTNLQDKLEKLFRMRRDKTIDPGFTQPYQSLLKHLGNPHLNLPPVIHLAGTNGKGSVIAFLRAILEEAGYSVHSYTSPHLLKFNERIILAGEMITDDYLHDLIDPVLAFSEAQPLTFFEATTALAFKAFSEVPADILLLETGLGGRLDCTNVLDAPLATIITSISYDHTEFLGDTISEIAYEKAGIMKAAVPCFVGMQKEKDAFPVFEKRAAELGTQLIRGGQDWHIEIEQDSFSMSEESSKTLYPPPALLGPHQYENAALVISALKHLSDLQVTEEHIKAGLRKVKWPGRLQKMDKSEALQVLPEGSELWYDGGHNLAAADMLSAQISLWKQENDKPVHLVIGMMGHKDHNRFLQAIVPSADGIICIDVEKDMQGEQAERLYQTIQDMGVDYVRKAETVEDAVQLVAADCQNACRVLVCGSLYLANQLL